MFPISEPQSYNVDVGGVRACLSKRSMRSRRVIGGVLILQFWDQGPCSFWALKFAYVYLSQKNSRSNQWSDRPDWASYVPEERYAWIKIYTSALRRMNADEHRKWVASMACYMLLGFGRSRHVIEAYTSFCWRTPPLSSHCHSLC